MADIHDLSHSRPDGFAPSDQDAERSVLGALLRDNRLVDDLSDQIAPEMFHEPTHGRLFAKILRFVQAGRLADAVTVFNGEQDAGLLQMGGFRYLLDLIDKAPDTPTAKSYAPIVRRLWQQREMLIAAQEITTGVRQGVDPDLTIEAAERALLAVQVQSRGVQLVTAAEAIERVQIQLDNPRAAFGVKTGLLPLDDVTGGFMPGELWLVAGRPGAGKSALASSIALNVAIHGRGPSGERLGVIEICSEMTVEQMMRRHVADLAHEMFGRDAPTYSMIRKRSLSASQRQMFTAAATHLRQENTMRSLYRTGLSVTGLRGIIRRQKAAWAREGISLGLVSVDHMGLIQSSQSNHSRHEAQSEIARDTKAIAGDLNCPMLALVQLNRKVEDRDDKRPLLSDLRDSGQWEECADGVLGIYREAYYAMREPEPKRHDLKLLWDERRTSPFVDAIFMKIREGEAQTVRLWADMGRNAIRGETPDGHYRPPPLVDLMDPDVALPLADYDGSFD